MSSGNIDPNRAGGIPQQPFIQGSPDDIANALETLFNLAVQQYQSTFQTRSTNDFPSLPGQLGAPQQGRPYTMADRQAIFSRVAQMSSQDMMNAAPVAARFAMNLGGIPVNLLPMAAIVSQMAQFQPSQGPAFISPQQLGAILQNTRQMNLNEARAAAPGAFYALQAFQGLPPALMDTAGQVAFAAPQNYPGIPRMNPQALNQMLEQVGQMNLQQAQASARGASDYLRRLGQIQELNLPEGLTPTALLVQQAAEEFGDVGF